MIAPRARVALAPPEEFDAYVCDGEYCDDGFHPEVPEPFVGYKIEVRPDDDPEYMSFDYSFMFIPASENKVHELTGYRMACGTWFVEIPSLHSYVRCGTCERVFDTRDEYDLHILQWPVGPREPCSKEATDDEVT